MRETDSGIRKQVLIRKYSIAGRSEMSEQPEFITKDTEGQEDQAQQSQSNPKKGSGDCREEPQLPKINFATFVISLNASVLVNLGLMDDPVTNSRSVNLPLAKQTIDTLSMLEKKTEGNLTEEEKKLLTNILYELRIQYVKKTTC